MTDKSRIQSAIDHIKSAVDVDEWAMKIAVDAMEKEVPKKPMKRIDTYNNSLYKLYCPSCKRWIASGNSRVGTLNEFTTYSDRCDRCGQMILWEGEAEEK